MNKLVLILSFLVLPWTLFSQQVEFFNGTWQEINDRAAKEEKFIFLDAYTDWCGWCKVMDKEMFTDPEIATFLNEHFIPVKINFEDSMGIILAMKFRVSGYPTTLVFNNYGQLTGKFSGYSEDHGKYLEFLKKNREIKEERVYAFDSRALDLPYPDFYANLFKKGEKRKWPSDSLVTNWLQEQPDLFTEVCWSVLLKFKPKAYVDYVIDNLEKYGALYGKEDAQDFIQSIIYGYVRKAADSTDRSYLDQAVQLSERLEKPEDQEVYIMMTYSEMTKDWPGFANALGSYIEMHGFESYSFINNNCWTLYENTDDKDILNRAVEWMKPVIEKEPVWMYLDTYAALLYKSGNLEEALIYADKAIAAGEEEKQEDISGTKDLREKILNDIKE